MYVIFIICTFVAFKLRAIIVYSSHIFFNNIIREGVV
nr:MAG TPA: hypothetical protein [Caudoviricetes sp.]DAK46668.1 MAG TPA: hypothetical protein [Caudoviricetes sp.]DAS95300.1 MAG TPA: hypothetical protein [Caudoviricetes sp.]